MTIDERGFNTEARSINDLTLAELQESYKELALENSKLSLKVRALENENQQIKMWASGSGFTSEAISTLRQSTLNRYFSNLPAIKKRRGAPTSLENDFLIAELWRRYELREDKKLGVKTWLRLTIEKDFAEYPKLSQINKTNQTSKLVRNLATAMHRKKPAALHN